MLVLPNKIVDLPFKRLLLEYTGAQKNSQGKSNPAFDQQELPVVKVWLVREHCLSKLRSYFVWALKESSWVALIPFAPLFFTVISNRQVIVCGGLCCGVIIVTRMFFLVLFIDKILDLCQRFQTVPEWFKGGCAMCVGGLYVAWFDCVYSGSPITAAILCARPQRSLFFSVKFASEQYVLHFGLLSMDPVMRSYQMRLSSETCANERLPFINRLALIGPPELRFEHNLYELLYLWDDYA